MDCNSGGEGFVLEWRDTVAHLSGIDAKEVGLLAVITVELTVGQSDSKRERENQRVHSSGDDHHTGSEPGGSLVSWDCHAQRDGRWCGRLDYTLLCGL